MSPKLNRRQFLQSSLVTGAALGMSGLSGAAQGQDATPETTPQPSSALTPEATSEATEPGNLPLTGAIRQVHDPCIIKADGIYYVFCTGDGIPVRQSTDLLNWESAFPASVFANVPDWAFNAIPGVTNLWAPDISFYNSKYHLYYAASTFGSNFSAIGLATNTTLNSKTAGFNWVDEEMVMQSFKKDDYNCIDPNLVLDENGDPWLAFGSFWSGIKMRRLDASTGKLSSDDQTLYSIAQRPDPTDAIEGAFITRRGKYFYLFASYDFCCRGAQSTYNVRVSRAEHVTGPYVDKDGVAALQGGGTEITFPTDRWKGPGHNGILIDGDTYYIAYHAYDAQLNGTPTLRINPLIWDANGWPSIHETD